ncbi:MAG: peptidylprolyl isomerase [Frankiales bacterium]|nr:peptidylprolyl isomerase [Frankiales bacterium]
MRIGRDRAVLPAALALAALAAACSGSSNGHPATLRATGAPTTPPPASGACTSPSGSPKHEQFGHEPKLTIARTTYTATVVTNCGTITVALDGKHAPHTVNSFAFLAGQHFFDSSPCHRLTTSGIYVLQCGDPTGTGTGGPGYTIPDENLKGATYGAGTVAMANTGQPHTGGSQFFFVYADTPLPPQYTPFGTVTAGLDILRRIAAAGSDDSNGPGDGAPKQPVVIESFTVTKG